LGDQDRLDPLTPFNEGESNPDLLFGGGQDFDRVAICNSNTAAVPNRFLCRNIAE
jgi:hypothetical protein